MPSSLRHATSTLVGFLVDLLRYGLVLGLASAASSTSAGINVALHAQVPPSSEMVVGSAVTMAGVRQALLRRHNGKMHAEGVSSAQQGNTIKIAHAEVFYPFTYSGLHERQWDLVIIEGWFKMINVFIHEVRAISYPGQVTILFYCLDPQFPGLRHVSALDVDGFLTNSHATQAYLLPSAPTALVPLAVDIEAFPFYPDPPPPPSPATMDALLADWEVGPRMGSGRVVYVGAAGAMEYKRMLAWMLRDAVPYGLDIYGSGWQDVPEFSTYWRGVLPEGDLASVYGKALVVIGVTMDAQRSSGMINNRVFEAMSVGAPLISEHFVALEAVFGDAIFYVREPGDVARHIERLLRDRDGSRRENGKKASTTQEQSARRRRRRIMIEEGHTWAHRVEAMLSFATSISDSSDGGTKKAETMATPTATVARCSRKQKNCLSLAIVVDPDLAGDVTFESTFVPAVDLLTSSYRIGWWMAPRDSPDHRRDERTSFHRGEDRITAGESFARRRSVRLPRDAGYLKEFDVVWAVGRWGGRADLAVRTELTCAEDAATADTGETRFITTRIAAQLRGIVLWGSDCTTSNATNDERSGGRKGRGEDDKDNFCPKYTGRGGLRWYDVVYCQTGWDHAILTNLASFNGAVSDNLQQAWGFGPSSYALPKGDESEASQGENVATYPSVSCDMLVVGTDNQIADMLQLSKSPGLVRVALGVIVPPAGPALVDRPGLLSALTAAGVDIGPGGNGGSTTLDTVDDLPQRFSLPAVDPDEGSLFTLRTVEVVLVRRASDAAVLAESAAMASKIVVVAAGDAGAWATLVVTNAASTGRGTFGHDNNGRRHAIDVLDITGDATTTSSSGYQRRIQDLAERLRRGPGEPWDTGYYARRLIGGMTRALCLGRGNSRVSMVRPAEGSSTMVGVGDTLTVEVRLEEFDPGRDGQWCITVEGRTLICALQNRLTVTVDISSSLLSTADDGEREGDGALVAAKIAGSGPEEDKGNNGGNRTGGTTEEGGRLFLRLEVVVELRSNMYMDVLRRSEPFELLVDPTGETTYGSGGCSYHAEGDTVVVVGGCNETAAGSNQDALGLGAFRASIDVKDFLQIGAVVVL